MSLRDYQQDLFDLTNLAFLEGKRRPLVVAPCGAGKSYIFMEMARKCKGEVLVLTHRHELKEQHEALVRKMNLNNVRVEMVITEYNHMLKREKPTLLILDEAHLSLTNTWETVVNYYDTYTIGFTATPIRLDGKPLGKVFDKLVQGVGVRWLIEHQYLAPFRYYAPLSIDISDAKVKNGDYVLSDVEYIMTNRAIYSDIVHSVNTICENKRQIIAYCVSLKHADMVCARFCDAGISARVITSKMALAERKKIMEDFKVGLFRVLCNVGIVCEGISVDSVDCCLLLRPTLSHALYWQQATRCLRYQPKKEALILDFVGNYTRNPLPDEEVEWGLDHAPTKKARINEEGNFTVRLCPSCYRTFKTAAVCPYCNTTYPLQQKEIEAHEKIQLEELSAEKQMQIQEEKKRLRLEVGQARTYPELLEIARKRGYKPSWARMVWNGRKR